jgi:polygalacturonase
MKSDVVLVVHAGASINASAVLADWSMRKLIHPPCASGKMPAELDHGVLGGLFYGSLAKNFTIRGPGAVNGAAAAWNEFHVDSALTTPGPPNPQGLIRSNMFVFSQCTDVVVEDLQIQDSSAWTLNPQYSQRMSFRRLTITAPALGSHGHNTDGFDPWACQNVEFVDSYYSGGDDCVAVKSGRDFNATPAGAWPCGTKYAAANITINNVTCDGSHGLTIGSEMSGGIDGVTFSNINIMNSGPAVRIKSQCGRRGYVKNILYENITVSQHACRTFLYDSIPSETTQIDLVVFSPNRPIMFRTQCGSTCSTSRRLLTALQTKCPSLRTSS